MICGLAAALPGRDIHVVADAAYAGKELRRLPAGVTWTTRLRKNAVLNELAPPRTGRRGRPRVKGARLPSLAALADQAAFAPVTVRRYSKTAAVQAAVITCLWHGAFGGRPVQVALVRDSSAAGYDLALVTTDLTASLPRSSGGMRPAGRKRTSKPPGLTGLDEHQVRRWDPGIGGPPWPCSLLRSSPSPPPPSTPGTGRADPADPQRNRRALRHADHRPGTRRPAPAAMVCLAATPPAPRQNLPVRAASQATMKTRARSPAGVPGRPSGGRD